MMKLKRILLIFTEQYLLNRINKMILNEVKNKDVCNSSTDYLENFIPKKKGNIYISMEKLISNEMLIHKIKKNIDVVDIENDNDVHFQYIFNVKEERLGGWGFDGDITDFLDKIFSSKEMEDNLNEFSDLIKNNLDKNLKDKKTDTLKSANIGYFYDESTWTNQLELSEDIKKESLGDTYFIKTKYNIYSKQFETTVNFLKLNLIHF